MIRALFSTKSFNILGRSIFLLLVCSLFLFGCKEDPIEIIPIDIQFQVTHVSKCAGCDGAIDVSVSGGLKPYVYLWSNNKTVQDIDSLVAGSYWLQITDNAEQVFTDTFEVREPGREVFSFSKIVHNVLSYAGNDGSINITISGGVTPYQFEWSNGSVSEDIFDLSEGIYWVKIIDAVDSVLLDSTRIEQPELEDLALVLTKQDITEYRANDGKAYAEVSGGLKPYAYLWSNGCTESEVMNMTEGMISITVTDAMGALVSDSIYINEPAPNALILDVDFSEPSYTGADDGWIKAQVSGGYPPYIFEWSNDMNSESLGGLSAGTYVLTVTDTENQVLYDTISLVDIMQDIDGNIYPIVKIGDQTWMKENLKVTHAPDGTEIISYAYNNDESNVEKYGRLYTWDVTMQGSVIEKDQGVCPVGWHVPSDGEVQILEMELGMTQTEASMKNTWRGRDVGTKLIVGGDSGFDALLSGRRDSNGSYRLLDSYEYTWTSTDYGNYAWRRCLRKSSNTVGRWNTFPKSYGFSVRCVKDE